MRHSAFPGQICSVARSLEIVGEWWTLLIVREAFFGTERFSEFAANLGIAKNVLTERLNSLVEAGVLEREPLPGRGNPVAYTLTAQGRDLLPVIVALMQWGDRWIHQKRAPVRILERKSGREIMRLRVTNHEGEPLALEDVVVSPGPGANDRVKRRFGKAKR